VPAPCFSPMARESLHSRSDSAPTSSSRSRSTRKLAPVTLILRFLLTSQAQPLLRHIHNRPVSRACYSSSYICPKTSDIRPGSVVRCAKKHGAVKTLINRLAGSIRQKSTGLTCGQICKARSCPPRFSEHAGSAKHHAARLRARRTTDSRCSARPSPTSPPKIPAISALVSTDTYKRSRSDAVL
jgi:hypothetical protein